MRKKIKTLTALVSASLSSGLNANQGISAIDIMANMPDTDNVSNSALLNRTVSHRLANHRSHSSHRSHRSHRSSSGGGGYSSPSYTAPAYTAPKPRPRPTPTPKSSSSSSPSSSYIKISDPLGQQPRPAKSYPSKSKKPKKTKADVKKIVEQVQLALLLEGLYEGPIDGVMGKATREAILKFKKQNNITSKVILGAETLNVLGVVGF
jgi:His-Xaa-Ser repeat protein HxsA